MFRGKKISEPDPALISCGPGTHIFLNTGITDTTFKLICH
jgi:hypothetical protein